MRKWLGKFVWLGVFALAAATLAAYSGEQSWILELTSHFRPHLVAFSFLWLFFALFQQRPVAVTACAALLAANAASIVPYVTGTPHIAPQTAGEEGSPLRVLTYNMHGRGTRRAAFVDFVHAEQPHVILLTELPPAHDWLTESLGADYPYRVDGTSGRPHDLMLLSRWPIAASHVDRSVDHGLPVLAADLCEKAEKNDPCLRLVGLHAVAPFGRLVARQDAQIALAARLAREAPHGRVVLAGDLNLTPWAPRFRRLLASGGLIDTALGRSVTATWLSRQPMVGLVIDHVLASPNIGVRDYQVGADLGSDHLPVTADLVIPNPVMAGPRHETAARPSSAAAP